MLLGCFFPVFRFLYKADSDSQWMEHELDYVLVVRNFQLPLLANPEEVDDVRYVDRQQLKHMFDNKDIAFSPWFRLLYKSKWLEEWWRLVDSNERVKGDGTIHKLN